MANVDIKLGYKSAAFFSANPTLVLKVGQVAFLENTTKYKVGDGTTQLSALAFSDAGFVASNGAITGATKTKITYDSKGLVTSGADATTAEISDSSNKRYVTDAQLTVIGNTSGTNTGDQDLSPYAQLASPTLTGTPLAPTAAAQTSTTQIATTAFVQQEKETDMMLGFGTTTFAPADSSTYYIGQAFWAAAFTADTSLKAICKKTGTIHKVKLAFRLSAGSNESSSIAIGVNGVYTTITSALDLSVVTNANYQLNITGLSISVTENDLITIRWITPAWVTNPTGVYGTQTIFIR